MKYKNLLLDIDGVIIDKKQSTNSTIYSLLSKLVQKGVTITFVTARPLEFAKPIINKIHLDKNYHVFDNGALVATINPTEILFSKEIPANEISQLLNIPGIINPKSRYGLSVGGQIIANNLYSKFLGKKYKTKNIGGAEMVNLNANSLWFYDLSLSVVQEVKEKFGHKLTIAHFIEDDQSHTIFIQNKEASKLSGFTALLLANKIELAETVYIADSENDIPLMVQVGLAAAPANASQKVLEMSHITSNLTHSEGTVDLIKQIWFS